MVVVAGGDCLADAMVGVGSKGGVTDVSGRSKRDPPYSDRSADWGTPIHFVGRSFGGGSDSGMVKVAEVV